MSDDVHLSRKHTKVLEEIFSHPLPHNLEWAGVLHLIEHLGSAVVRHDGKYEFQIGSITSVFIKPVHKDMETEEVIRLRNFLKQAGVSGA